MILPSRLAVMTALAGGLYLAPFLAGLSGHPALTVPVFAAFLALWSVLYQPGAWPRRVAQLASPAGLAGVALRACAMLALAGVCFLAANGLSHITCPLPLPLAVPLAVPAVALTLAVLLHSPRQAAAMDAFLDDALRQIQGMAIPAADSRQGATAELLARRIGALPPAAGVAEVLAIVEGARDLDAALLSAIDRLGVPPPRPARLAAVLLATDPEHGSGLAGRGEAAWVFDLTWGDPELEVLFARRALALLSDAPHMARDMPYSYDVAEAGAATSDPEAAALLDALRDRLDRLSAAEDGA